MDLVKLILDNMFVSYDINIKSFPSNVNGIITGRAKITAFEVFSREIEISCSYSHGNMKSFLAIIEQEKQKFANHIAHLFESIPNTNSGKYEPLAYQEQDIDSRAFNSSIVPFAQPTVSAEFPGIDLNVLVNETPETDDSSNKTETLVTKPEVTKEEPPVTAKLPPAGISLGGVPIDPQEFKTQFFKTGGQPAIVETPKEPRDPRSPFTNLREVRSMARIPIKVDDVTITTAISKAHADITKNAKAPIDFYNPSVKVTTGETLLSAAYLLENLLATSYNNPAFTQDVIRKAKEDIVVLKDRTRTFLADVTHPFLDPKEV